METCHTTVGDALLDTDTAVGIEIEILGRPCHCRVQKRAQSERGAGQLYLREDYISVKEMRETGPGY